MKRNIFLVDDDSDLLAILQVKLGKDGFNVWTASDGESAIQAIKQYKPDLVVMDVNMPKMSGMEVCRALRAKKETRKVPIIFLTARGEEVDRVLGLEFGADDYITKPFNTRELVLRIKNILKRVYGSGDADEVFRFGCLTVDFGTHSVKVGEKKVDLTVTEFKILSLLVESPGKIKPREVLLDQIWGYKDGVFSRTVDTHIQRLRSKLKEAGQYIETVRGVGYRFQEIV